ncbi:polymorphic toxin type 15 domain-containing protein [Metabacillus sp. 113a]|uniref:polymorphic toxin type 15 domain-containing protein n=1 Tax=Metabacillus sp. 113a TaxID=3404706 RepID=UPI003CF902AB
MGAAGEAAHIIDKGGLRKLADKAPYSTAYAKDYVAKAQNNMKQIGKQVGTKAHQFIKETPGAAKRAHVATGRELAKVDVPVVVRREVVTTTGESVKTLSMESRKLEDDFGGGKVNKGTGNAKHLSAAPRIKEIEVNFKKNVKHDSEEYARQLKDQEIGMNELTVDEYLKNRDRYIAEGRAIEGNAAQKMARQEALKDKISEENKVFQEQMQLRKLQNGWKQKQHFIIPIK